MESINIITVFLIIKQEKSDYEKYRSLGLQLTNKKLYSLDLRFTLKIMIIFKCDHYKVEALQLLLNADDILFITVSQLIRIIGVIESDYHKVYVIKMTNLRVTDKFNYDNIFMYIKDECYIDQVREFLGLKMEKPQMHNFFTNQCKSVCLTDDVPQRVPIFWKSNTSQEREKALMNKFQLIDGRDQLPILPISRDLFHAIRKFENEKEMEISNLKSQIIMLKTEQQQLKEKYEEKGDYSTKCVICISNNKCILLESCNHLCLCEKCVDEMTHPLHKYIDCPICRQCNTKWKKVFM